ncbi:MAG TPA: GNAT family N-acetyltransferase [Candidatus Saccharimonadales bacterium]|nr:GNAT family N-acetyltransferase [Candidatus Saccharimonadales bacterium]
MPVTIRKGLEDDFPALMKLINELAEFEKAPNPPKNSAEQMKREREYFNFFVAEADGRVIGAAVYFFAYYTWVGKSLYLDDFYVIPEYRGKGIGSRLLRKIFEAAKQADCKRVRFQVIDWNKDAISLYRRRGAEISNEWLNCDFDEDRIRQFLEKTKEAE